MSHLDADVSNPSVLFHGIGDFFDGTLDGHRRDVSALLTRDGVVAEINPSTTSADVVVDVRGGAILPGLVDGHVHPVGGDWTPVQNAQGWVENYLHGGTTSLVSAGELHFPGLDPRTLTPELAVALVELLAATRGGVPEGRSRLSIGTLLLIPGLRDEHFDRARAAGSGVAKFLFYPFDTDALRREAVEQVAACRQRGLVTKIHTGGVSRSGLSSPTGADLVLELDVDVAAHVSGGPIPMPDDDIRRLAAEGRGALEICSSMNYRSTTVVVEALRAHDALDRLVVGTDTPGGTGVVPRGMLRNITLLTGVCGLTAAQAIAAATGNTARAHGLDVGVLTPGAPADLLVAGRIRGSTGETFAESLQLGNLPGLSMVMVGGAPLLFPRTDQLPPVEHQIHVER